MKKFLNDRIIIINDKTYIREKDKLRLVIDDYLEKIKIIGMVHRRHVKELNEIIIGKKYS